MLVNLLAWRPRLVGAFETVVAMATAVMVAVFIVAMVAFPAVALAEPTVGV